MKNSKPSVLNTKKAIVSACLLGEYCRYDGKTKCNKDVLEALQGYEIIPFCPEAPIFGTPRERINIIEINGEERVITDSTNVDVTQKLQNEIDNFTKKHQDADIIILKSKSPSCGLGTTPILDTNKKVLRFADGIGAKMFKQKYSCKIIDENNLSSLFL